MGAHVFEDQAIHDHILDSLRSGATLRDAAAAAGVSYAALQRWRQQGAKGIAPFAAIARAQDEAMAEFRQSQLATIVTASKVGTWQAAAWVLEKRDWRTYDQRAVVGHLNAQAQRMANLGDLTNQQVLQHLRDIVRAKASKDPSFCEFLRDVVEQAENERRELESTTPAEDSE